MSKKTKDALVVGFALFAVFFGAGNLIFPPLVGVVSGSGWPAAIMGLMLSGILLPIATIVAVASPLFIFKFKPFKISFSPAFTCKSFISNNSLLIFIIPSFY